MSQRHITNEQRKSLLSLFVVLMFLPTAWLVLTVIGKIFFIIDGDPMIPAFFFLVTCFVAPFFIFIEHSEMIREVNENEEIEETEGTEGIDTEIEKLEY